MRSNSRWAVMLAIVAVALMAGLSACGSDSGGSSSSTAAVGVPEDLQPVTAAPDNAKEGGELNVLAAGDIDFMDPGAAYYQFTYEVAYATGRPLMSWEPDDSEQPSPDLSDGDPKVSDDGKTITFTIRDGVKFGPPVNREVTAADVEYALERTTLPGVANQYAAGYLASVDGYADAVKEATKNPTGGAPDIPGITATDDKTLEIKLTQPEAPFVVQALSLPMSVPVPEEYAKEFDAKNPSTYGQYVVASGPYMVENDPDTGELTGYTPGKEIKLIRNPNWDPESDYRPAYLDKINIEEGFADPGSATRKILDGDSSVAGDFPVPKELIEQASKENNNGQLQIPILPGTRYIALNTSKPPFDDINVRKAVVANSDRTALRNTRGGPLVGAVATHYISPGFPGFEDAGGVEGPDLDFIKDPNGNPDIAAEYMKQAGYDSGKCEGSDCDITMVGDNIAPGKDTAEVFKGQLEDLGFNVSFQPVDHAIMYTRFCSVPDQQPNVCPNVGWLPDFRDGQAMLDVPFYGANIDPENNSNWPQLDDPKVNDAIEQARTAPEGDERTKAWADVDRLVSEQAPAVPWDWENYPLSASENVAGVVNLQNASWDLSFTSLK
jgi:peptide/nickel transport system substrate-binding protein